MKIVRPLLLLIYLCSFNVSFADNETEVPHTETADSILQEIDKLFNNNEDFLEPEHVDNETQPSAEEALPEFDEQDSSALKAILNWENKKHYKKYVEMQLLDKITARSSYIKKPVGEEINFGNLIIRPRICWGAFPDEIPESKVLLDVWDKNIDGDKLIFSGWMFASSPSISSLEHPVLDITILNCSN